MEQLHQFESTLHSPRWLWGSGATVQLSYFNLEGIPSDQENYVEV